MSKKNKKEKDEVKKPKKKAKAPVAEAAAKPKEVKAAKPAKAAKPVKKKEAKVIITNDDIALRAYFIAERRQAAGGHGDEHGDWVEAERQLRAEAGKK